MNVAALRLAYFTALERFTAHFIAFVEGETLDEAALSDLSADVDEARAAYRGALRPC